MGSKRYIIISVAVTAGIIAGCIIALWFFWMIGGGARATWPEIDDPAALMTDAEYLLTRYSVGAVVFGDELPETILELNPGWVEVGNGVINIRISGGGVREGWGFLIVPGGGPEPTSERLKIIRTTDHGIFKYLGD